MDKVLVKCTVLLCRTLLFIALWRDGERRLDALSEELDRLEKWCDKTLEETER